MFQRTIILCCLVILALGFPMDERAVRGRKKNKYVKIDDMLFKKKTGKAGVNQSWPNGIVPYIIDPAVVQITNLRTYILQSHVDISRKTCIKFVQKTNEEYWLKYAVDPDDGCSAVVGWQKEADQLVNLSDGCTKGNIVHETLHALGFLHEHTRDDRDKHVIVDYTNIQQTPINTTFNFVKDKDSGYPGTNYYNVKYNFESIMHYGPTFFAIDENKNTITAKKNTGAIGNPDNMGQRAKLTDGDYLMINNKYNCKASG